MEIIVAVAIVAAVAAFILYRQGKLSGVLQHVKEVGHPVASAPAAQPDIAKLVAEAVAAQLAAQKPADPAVQKLQQMAGDSAPKYDFQNVITTPAEPLPKIELPAPPPPPAPAAPTYTAEQVAMMINKAVAAAQAAVPAAPQQVAEPPVPPPVAVTPITPAAPAPAPAAPKVDPSWNPADTYPSIEALRADLEAHKFVYAVHLNGVEVRPDFSGFGPPVPFYRWPDGTLCQQKPTPAPTPAPAPAPHVAPQLAPEYATLAALVAHAEAIKYPFAVHFGDTVVRGGFDSDPPTRYVANGGKVVRQ